MRGNNITRQMHFRYDSYGCHNEEEIQLERNLYDSMEKKNTAT